MMMMMGSAVPRTVRFDAQTEFLMGLVETRPTEANRKRATKTHCTGVITIGKLCGPHSHLSREVHTPTGPKESFGVWSTKYH